MVVLCGSSNLLDYVEYALLTFKLVFMVFFDMCDGLISILLGGF